MIKLIKRAPARFRKSFRYSWNGLKSTFLNEESFRLESIAFIVLVAVMAIIDWPTWKKLVMIATYLLIPLVELLNTAIEDVCDLISRDHQPLIKNAKDKGAMAVLVAIIINALVLVALIAE